MKYHKKHRRRKPKVNPWTHAAQKKGVAFANARAIAEWERRQAWVVRQNDTGPEQEARQ